ncbi:MAG: alpha/beta fold hydrolase [Deltaproteobacteria bacterium]|nr:alpha/beta fold hydrolase [Deltaproteobacteria bacterium]
MTLLSLLLVAALSACGGGGERGEIVRTPDDRFQDLPGWSFEPHYEVIDGLRIHYIDEGPASGRPVLLLHGEPSWAYLYRKMVPVLADAGLRVIAPDLVGFGRSDKYVRVEDYSYAMQVEVMAELVRRLDLQDAVFFGQDWGGLVGLRVVAEDPDRFAAVVIGNTALPLPGEGASPPFAFRAWQLFSRYSPVFPISGLIDTATTTELSREVKAAYDAPFPSSRYMAGARAMPSLVPTTSDDPAVSANRAAWEVFDTWEKPFVLAFSDGDPITRGADAPFRERVPGAQGQPHTTIEAAGHFLQEDGGEELAALIALVAEGLATGPPVGPAIGTRIFHGGSILTMNPEQPSAEAVVVTDGRIRLVGTVEAARRASVADAEWIDLESRALLPGFIDAHSHLMQTALKLATVAMDPPPAGDVTSIADIQARFRAELERSPRGADEWLVGWGYDNGMLADGRHPTREDLDSISTEVPIFLLHFSIHQSVLNSRALELIGITADSEAPEGGVIRRLPGSREPNGILEETAHIPALMRVAGGILNDGTGETLRRLVAEAVQLYARNGYTTVTEMGADTTSLAQMRMLADEGRFPLDVVAYLFYLTTSTEEAAAAYTPNYTNRFRVGGGKINLDGGSPGRTAFLREPYHQQLPGEDGYRGYSSIEEQGRLDAIVASYYERDVPLAIHALGDAALDQCIAAVRAAEKRFPRDDRRTQLIHLQQVQEDQFEVLTELDVTLTFQVAHNYYFGDYHREVIYGPERTERLNPLKSALRRDFSVTLHHDSPVHPVDPFMLLWAAVDRTTRSGRVIGPDQRISVQQALEASTLEAARQLFEEDEKGSIEVGKLADLVIVDRNPLGIPTPELRNLMVVETIKEGRTIYRRNRLSGSATR